MLSVEISFQLNKSKEEKEKLSIDIEAISEFLGKGFQDNIYQGRVNFELNSRYDLPQIIDVIILLPSVIENIELISENIIFVLKQLEFLMQKHKNYEPNIILKKEEKSIKRKITEGNKEIFEVIEEKSSEIQILKDISEEKITELVKENF
jgi:hypothetical protein